MTSSRIDSFAIRAALPGEAETISAIALRSKAHWNYTPEQLEVFRIELTLTPDQLLTDHAHVAVQNRSIRGFYTLELLDEGRAELGHLFVDPNHLGRGIGRSLLEHACERARSLGLRAISIQSDPNAAAFYAKLGAQRTGEVASSIPGRSLPCFEFQL